jgi:putative ABC transport system permease protein
MSLAAVLIGLFLLAYGALAVIALRRPLLARLAYREAVRRPLQSALVVLGLMIGSASIVSLQVFTDSQIATGVETANVAWGRVDLVVDANGRLFGSDVAQRLGADPQLAGSMAGAQNGMELTASVGDLDQRLGKPAVRVIGFDPATQRAFGAYALVDGTTTYGDDLPTRSVLLSRQLADALKAHKGDRLHIAANAGAPGPGADLLVAGIARQQGPGASGLRPAVFIPLATAQALLGTDQINIIRIAARGDDQIEVDHAATLTAQLRTKVPSDLVVRAAKADEVASVRRNLENNRGFTVVESLFIVLAGTALVVNLMLGLAEERRPRWAVIRAMGLTRAGLVQLAVLEGAVYSLAAAVMGAIPGFAFAWLLTIGFANSVRENYGGSLNAQDMVVRVAALPDTVLASIAAASMITLATLFFTTLRASGLSISSAIKNLPEPAVRSRRRSPLTWTLLLLALGGALVIVPGNSTVNRYLAGLLLIIAAFTLVRGLLSVRVGAGLLGAGVTAWSVGMAAAESVETARSSVGAFILFLTLIGAVFGLCIFLTANLRLLETLAGLIGRQRGRLMATLRPPLAYLSRRPVRSGLGMGAFAVVLGMLGAYYVFGFVFAGNASRDTAGYDVAAFSSGTPSITIPGDLESQTTQATQVTTRIYYGPLNLHQAGQESGWAPTYVSLYELTDEQLSDPPVRLTQRDPGFSSDHELFMAMRNDPTLVVANNFFQPVALGLIGRDGPLTLKVVGQWAPGALFGIVGSQAAFAPFSHLLAGSTLLIKTAPGVDPEGFAVALRRELFSTGVDADTTRHLLYLRGLPGRAFLDYVVSVTRIGLVIGVASLGLLVLRALIERRRVIGLLRALGYAPRQVLTGMLGEAVLTATAGIIVGVAAGTGLGYLYVRIAYSATTLGIDGPATLGSVAAVYAAVLLVAFVPALRASRLAPSEALRLVD